MSVTCSGYHSLVGCTVSPVRFSPLGEHDRSSTPRVASSRLDAMVEMRRDRLRELLDAVLAEGSDRRSSMARAAYSSEHHFSRQVRLGTDESPVALRRRVVLERAAWRLRGGSSVTEVALSEGYASVEGFSRAFSSAFGHPPSATRADSARWLPAPNGIHFHPPTSLWVDSTGTSEHSMDLAAHLVHHDVEDTRSLLRLAATVAPGDLDRPLLPGHVVLDWDGPEESVAAVLEHLVWTKEVWLASIDGADVPSRGGSDLDGLVTRHDAVAPRWVSTIQRVAEEGRWEDVLVDALCDPPESFVLASVVSHVVTFSAYRRQVVRQMLRSVGVAADHGDPIMWLRQRGQPSEQGSPS